MVAAGADRRESQIAGDSGWERSVVIGSVAELAVIIEAPAEQCAVGTDAAGVVRAGNWLYVISTQDFASHMQIEPKRLLAYLRELREWQLLTDLQQKHGHVILRFAEMPDWQPPAVSEANGDRHEEAQ